MPKSKPLSEEYALLEELMFTYKATSEKTAIEKERVVSNLDTLQSLKEKGYIVELKDGRIHITSDGTHSLFAFFS
jgi:hypothetical protein